MRIKTLLMTLAALLLGHQSSFGQGGPFLGDLLSPKAWPNPVFEFSANTLDPYFPTTVLQGQTVWVASRNELELKHKDYYVFFNHDKQNGSAEGGWLSSDEHMAYLLWEDPSFPGEPQLYPDPPEVYEAIPFSQYDPQCFQELSGPYCQIADNPTFFGKVGKFWVAVSGLNRTMGGKFTAFQIEKIKGVNKNRNGNSTMKSDLRVQLVTDFLLSHPNVSASEIPVDTVGNTLSTDLNAENFAVVAHILPAIAPEGNGCGRNAYRNALVVSSNLNDDLVNAGFPSDGFIMYCEWLSSLYNKKIPQPTPPKAITYKTMRDLGAFVRADIEYLEEDETRAIMDYVRGGGTDTANPATPKR